MNPDTGEVYEGEPKKGDVRLDPFLLPREYLMRNQQSDPDRVTKILAQAEQRRQDRKAKRLKAAYEARG